MQQQATAKVQEMIKSTEEALGIPIDTYNDYIVQKLGQAIQNRSFEDMVSEALQIIICLFWVRRWFTENIPMQSGWRVRGHHQTAMFDCESNAWATIPAWTIFRSFCEQNQIYARSMGNYRSGKYIDISLNCNRVIISAITSSLVRTLSLFSKARRLWICWRFY